MVESVWALAMLGLIAVVGALLLVIIGLLYAVAYATRKGD